MKNAIDKIRGSLVGGAVGDALGYPVEFMSFSEIQRRFGENGITSLACEKNLSGYAGDSDKALISDDTQMTLFTACGLLNTENHEQRRDSVKDAYVEWYYTQNMRNNHKPKKCWIADLPEMNQRRAPGGTCLSALDLINVEMEPHNESKGCGGVMRTAPVALYGAVNDRMTIVESVKLAGDAAKLTHQHPLGWLPSSLEAYIIYSLLQNDQPRVEDFRSYVVEGIKMLKTLYPSNDNMIQYLENLINRALALANLQGSDVSNIEESLGGGWVGEEALAIAIYCVAKYFNDFEKAVVAAVNHSGDSDSTGAVTGNIIGAVVGYDAIPQYYKDSLELHDVILHVADDIWRGKTTNYMLNVVQGSDVPLKPLFNSYKVTDWLYAGEYPGDKCADKAEEKISQCLRFGITHFIDLTEEDELVPYESLLKGKANYLRFPIRDVSVPEDTESVRRLMAFVKQIRQDDMTAKVYIHCWGGVGRTGVIVACFLGYFEGLNFENAIDKLKRLFMDCPKYALGRVSPETHAQLDFVRRFIQNLQ